MPGPFPKASKQGRNDPCWCGSGKKYKACHLPSDEAAHGEQRKLVAAQDTLLLKLIEAAENVPQVFPQAFELFWGGRYTPEQMTELDDLEERGAERFLSWLAFNYLLNDGRTLVETLAQDIDRRSFELDGYEERLLHDWQPVRMRPYRVEAQLKGQTLTLSDMLGSQVYEVLDHAASRRVMPGEVLVGHLVPAGEQWSIAGAVAHLTGDTAEKLVEFASLYLEDLRHTQPDASWQDLLRTRSYILNQFVIALPREEADPALLDTILLQTRQALSLTGQVMSDE